MRPWTYTRLMIVAWEVVFLGGFLLAMAFLQVEESSASLNVTGFDWVYGIIGATTLLVGFETVAPVRHLRANVEKT